MTVSEIHSLFKKIIWHTKIIRNFNSEKYLVAKTEKINSFFKENNLDSCVLGISGGIDSAVVYKLLLRASKQNSSPLKKIVALLMPIYGIGTSNQNNAMEKGLKVIEASGITSCYVNDLTTAMESYCATLKSSHNPDAWSVGQLASIVRTPHLYFHAALLQQEGFKSLVSGTTNRDEGSYIGFFGKASDAMVDLQPIADIHKSEVYEIAKLLNVPEEVINATPAGDVWDGKTDEEMIGAPYWFLEMYLLMKEYKIDPGKNISKEAMPIYLNYAKAIESIHNKNAHKYQVGNPSHFIDVMPRAIPEGWKI
jgi:NAD+ synthetase